MTARGEQLLSELGFRFGTNGPHAARTMMLDDVATLSRLPMDAGRADYVREVVELNALAKPTRKARELAIRHLATLYGLDPSLTVFRAFRRLRASDEAAAPVLALFVALARDPLLRATQSFILGKQVGQTVTRDEFEQVTLGDLLTVRPKSGLEQCAATATIAYRERLKSQQKQRYALKDADESLRAEWRELLAYKVALGSGGRHRLARSTTGKWSTTANPTGASKERAWYAFHAGRYVASANIVWQMISQYLGWLMLEKEAGGKGLCRSESMTLARLTRDDFLAEYYEWATARSGGTPNGGTVRFLQTVASLCHPETGFLTQSCDTFSPGALPAAREKWLEDCKFAFNYARTLKNDLRGVVQASRDSFEPIQTILALPNPLDGIADAIARLDAARPTTGGQAQAVWVRDRLLLKLLASNPLRIKNAENLTYRADGSGHLRKVDGVWRIHIPKAEFKNFLGAAQDRIYDMPVRPEVWPDIERYLLDYRPMLSSTGSHYVFVSIRDVGTPMFGLRRRFEALSKRYFAGCPGVGPHGMRHIVATSILKLRPNDWVAAAWALHDREDTVRQHYAHLRSDDAYRWFDTAMSAPFSRM